MWILETINKVLTQPTKFFASLKKEKNINKALLYLCFIAVVDTVLSVLFPIKYPNVMFFPAIFALFENPIILFVLVFFGSLVLNFLLAHLVNRLIPHTQKKDSFSLTFQVLTYGSTPSLLRRIPFIGILFSLWSYYLMTKGLAIVHKKPMWDAFFTLLIAAIILVIIIVFIAAIGFLLALAHLQQTTIG